MELPAGFRIPAGLDWMRHHPEGRAFRDSLPARVDAAVARWGLRLGAPLTGGGAALTLLAESAGGTRTVLKIPFPDRESRYEAEALRHWAGAGAVRLLDRDPETGAMLLERAEPGTPLYERPAAEALTVLCGLLPRLWRPAGEPFTPLSDEAAHWAAYLPGEWAAAGRPFPRRLLDAALEVLTGPADPERVLLHQDLHAGNVLAAGREPWLVIDPKPLVGERAFGLAPAIRGRELGHGRTEVRYRLDLLSAELGVNRERARQWALAQTVAWGFENGRALPGHVQVAQWLLDTPARAQPA